MAKINHIIGPRVHEIIRTRVAQILAEELAEQSAMTYDDDFMLPIYVHRFKPVMPEELPIAIVSTNSGSFDNMDVQKSDGKFPIFMMFITVRIQVMKTEVILFHPLAPTK
jgi:hypothetical protein